MPCPDDAASFMEACGWYYEEGPNNTAKLAREKSVEVWRENVKKWR
jgi:hypothetical protein